MSNNLFNSKNLWIDTETARVLGINLYNTVYINGDKVVVNHFYSDNIELAIPLFALRTEQLYKLFSKKSDEAFYFRVFSNFKENISRLFSEDYESLELLVQSNRILEEEKEMHEAERINVFFRNNELSSKKITKSMDKKIKKLINKKKELEEKNYQLKTELKKQLFMQFNSSNETIDLEQQNLETNNIIDDELIIEKPIVEEKNSNNEPVILNNIDKNETMLEDIILETKVVEVKQEQEDITNLTKVEKVITETKVVETKTDEITKEEDIKLNMDVEEETISETIVESEIKEYETISLENIDKSTYSKECLKIDQNITKNQEKIKKINEKIYSIVGKETKTPEEFKDVYNKVSARLESIKAKAKIANNLSTEEFKKIKPYVVAEMQNLVFVCYDAMCEANAIYDDSREMFAKLILLIKRNLASFDNKNK